MRANQHTKRIWASLNASHSDASAHGSRGDDSRSRTSETLGITGPHETWGLESISIVRNLVSTPSAD
jgi:hypothetical protein